MKTIRVDSYVVETLLPDLVGHDRSSSSFLVYVYLWSLTLGGGAKSVRASHSSIAAATGLSKSAVQGALRNLTRRKLVRTERQSVTATPEHYVLRPWRGSRS